jgi:hypothetical protein
VAKGKLFKFRDGVKEIKVGDTVWEVCADNRRKTCGQKFVVSVGTKYITVSHTMSNPNRWNNTQYSIETGRVKSDYSTGLSLYSSEEAEHEYFIQFTTRDQLCAKMRGHYSPPDWLTYDKACRILKILEET